MDPEISSLLAGFVAGTIGFSLFLYGKRQSRAPQLAAGTALSVLPFVVGGAMWIATGTVAVIGGLWLAIRAGW